MGKASYHGVIHKLIRMFNLAEENLGVIKTSSGAQQGKEGDESADGEELVVIAIEDYLSMNLKSLLYGFT